MSSCAAPQTHAEAVGAEHGAWGPAREAARVLPRSLRVSAGRGSGSGRRGREGPDAERGAGRKPG